VTPDRSTPRSATVVFRAGLGVANWSARHAQSPVPGRWPYGLDGLADAGLEVVSSEAPATPRWRRVLPSPVRSALRAVNRRRPTTDVALCWDEQTVTPMLDSVRARRYFSGVIWATDRVAAGGSRAELEDLAADLRTADGLWVLSRPQIDSVRDWLGPGCPPVHFLRFGIDADFYAAHPYPQRPHVVSAGGDRDRDPATLFDALAQVRQRRPDVELTVQTSSTLTPPEGVTVVPRLPHVQVAELLASATVVAIPTRANLHASGMTVGLEAMSVGRPVVMSDTPGMRDDYFNDGEDACLVPVGDADAVADRILRLLDDPERAAAMGAAGRARVERRHTSVQMCQELSSLVQK
jgi:glycosyltransferase involved in cell wall biosynthesis